MQERETEQEERFHEEAGTFITHTLHESWLNLYTTLDAVDWKLVQTIGMKDVLKGFNTWWKISILCILIVAAAVFVVLYLLDKSIFQPVNYLYHDMERLKEGKKRAYSA